MRVTVFHNSIPASIKAAQKLLKLLKNGHFELDERHPQVVITIGGDGTLLSAFHRYADQLDTIRFIGVHTGHLGFYTDWRDFEIEDLVIALKRRLRPKCQLSAIRCSGDLCRCYECPLFGAE